MNGEKAEKKNTGAGQSARSSKNAVETLGRKRPRPFSVTKVTYLEIEKNELRNRVFYLFNILKMENELFSPLDEK
jgi:hypothetical protein